jgi:hypothetical protein
MTDKLRDDLAEVVRQMRSIAEPNDHLLTTLANTIEGHHAQIQRNAEDASRYRWLRDVWSGWTAIGGKMQAHISTPSWRGDWPSFDAAMDAAMRANGGEVDHE